MPQHPAAISNHPTFTPPQRAQPDVTKAAVERARQTAELAAVTAKVERAKSRGQGTQVDVVA